MARITLVRRNLGLGLFITNEIVSAAWWAGRCNILRKERTIFYGKIPRLPEVGGSEGHAAENWRTFSLSLLGGANGRI